MLWEGEGSAATPAGPPSLAQGGPSRRVLCSLKSDRAALRPARGLPRTVPPLWMSFPQAQCYIDLARLLVTGTNHFYNNPTFSDITLVCPDGRQLKCHQVILAASSKRLAAVLKQGALGVQLPSSQAHPRLPPLIIQARRKCVHGCHAAIATHPPPARLHLALATCMH